MVKSVLKSFLNPTHAFLLTSIFLAVTFASESLKAQSIVKLKAKKEEAAVYLKPDFDAKVIYLLPKDKVVVGTRSTVEGLNGLGLFHKVKLSDKIYGYMLDTEVQITNSAVTQKKNPKNGIKKKAL